MALYELVEQYIRRELLLEAGQRLVIGVSGGADSLCLLDCLHHLGYGLVVGHLDHGLHPNSRGDMAYVSQLAESYGLPFQSKRVEIPLGRGSLEEKARILRYQFLTEVAGEHELTTIAVGHTVDDQTETVLMHLLRGSGSSGLRGMLPRTQLESWIGLEGAAGLSLVRPLMEIEHFQTVAHCRAIGIEPRKDPSNDDLSFFRNRLRHELIPQLKSYNPGIHDVLARTAKIMAADADLVAHLVEGSWEEWVRNAGESVFAIQRKPMLEAPIALQRAAIRKLIRSLRPAQRDIGFEVVEAILGGMRGRNGVRRSIVGGLELIPLTNEIVIREPGARISFPDRPQLQSGRSELLQIPGKWELANGWSIEARQLAAEGRSWSADAEFDRDGLGGELVLRRAADGDRITPVGMLGSVKLSDLFINRKIPQPARQYWPVVADGPNVLWVPRLHRSRLAAVTPESNRIIAFRLRGPAV